MSRDYCNYLIGQLAPWDEVRARAMFGGYGLYRREIFFGLVGDDTLHFKVDDVNRPDYEAAGSSPFAYSSTGKQVTMSYWQVPLDVIDEPDILAEWAEKACAAAIRAKAKPPRRKKPAS